MSTGVQIGLFRALANGFCRSRIATWTRGPGVSLGPGPRCSVRPTSMATDFLQALDPNEPWTNRTPGLLSIRDQHEGRTPDAIHTSSHFGRCLLPQGIADRQASRVIEMHTTSHIVEYR
jgi:hypothetical protein